MYHAWKSAPALPFQKAVGDSSSFRRLVSVLAALVYLLKHPSNPRIDRLNRMRWHVCVVKTSQQGQGLENVLSSLGGGSYVLLCYFRVRVCGVPYVSRAMQPANSSVITLTGMDEHLSGSNSGIISRRPKRVTKEGLGCRADTTAARVVAILVRCCS